MFPNFVPSRTSSKKQIYTNVLSTPPAPPKKKKKQHPTTPYFVCFDDISCTFPKPNKNLQTRKHVFVHFQSNRTSKQKPTLKQKQPFQNLQTSSHLCPKRKKSAVKTSKHLWGVPPLPTKEKQTKRQKPFGLFIFSRKITKQNHLWFGFGLVFLKKTSPQTVAAARPSPPSRPTVSTPVAGWNCRAWRLGRKGQRVEFFCFFLNKMGWG